MEHNGRPRHARLLGRVLRHRDRQVDPRLHRLLPRLRLPRREHHEGVPAGAQDRRLLHFRLIYAASIPALALLETFPGFRYTDS